MNLTMIRYSVAFTSLLKSCQKEEVRIFEKGVVGKWGNIFLMGEQLLSELCVIWTKTFSVQ